MLGWRDESWGRWSTEGSRRATLLPICCGLLTHGQQEPGPSLLPAALGTRPGLPLQHQPRGYLPSWSINNRNTGFSAAYLQSAWSLGQPLRFSEPPSQGGLFTAQQTARSARSKCQGQRDHSPPLGNGAKVFAADPGRWSSPRRTPHAAGSRPRSRSSEKKTGSPHSVAKRHH